MKLATRFSVSIIELDIYLFRFLNPDLLTISYQRFLNRRDIPRLLNAVYSDFNFL